jgi:LacI family transcriptional regulator
VPIIVSPKSNATITDVARLAGVSPKSISRVVNGQGGVSEETRQRIMDAINTLGYVANPAARRLRGSSNVIGLIVSGFEDYLGQIMLGISQTAERFSYNVVLYVQNTTQQPAESYLPLIRGGMIDGLLLIVPHDLELLTELCNEQGMPYVMIDYAGDQAIEKTPTITVTNRKGVIDAMRYLLALGHRRIGFITGQMEMASARERLQGYKDGLAEVGLSYDECLVIEGDWSSYSGFEATRRMLSLEQRPTAIIASDDASAFGAMDAIKDALLRVGEDVSVIGFDDIPRAAQVYPPLTTVHQPLVEMGQAAVDILIDLLQGRTPISLHREFATDLVVRQSTGKPKFSA